VCPPRDLTRLEQELDCFELIPLFPTRDVQGTVLKLLQASQAMAREIIKMKATVAHGNFKYFLLVWRS
jgi:hypothetical protein